MVPCILKSEKYSIHPFNKYSLGSYCVPAEERVRQKRGQSEKDWSHACWL